MPWENQHGWRVRGRSGCFAGGTAFWFNVNWSVASSDATVHASCRCKCEWAPDSVTCRLGWGNTSFAANTQWVSCMIVRCKDRKENSLASQKTSLAYRLSFHLFYLKEPFAFEQPVDVLIYSVCALWLPRVCHKRKTRMNRVGPFQMAILSAYSAPLSVMVNTADNAPGCGVNLPKRNGHSDPHLKKK